MSSSKYTVEELLTQFQSLSNSTSYPWLYEYDGQKHDYHLHVSALIHGNETGSLPSIIQTIRNLTNGSLHYGGRLTLTLGNPEAARVGVRYLESDLNRAFLNTGLKTHEAARAQTLMPIFNRADLLLDLHQTILKTQHPFYIFPHQTEAVLWARAMRLTQYFVDATPSPTSQTRCADEFFWHQNKPAITLELSQKGFNPHAETLSLAGIHRTVSLIDRIQAGEDLQSIAESSPVLHHYTTVYRHPFSPHAHTLRPNLNNFMSVQAGERLSPPNEPVIEAPISGELLFPKYLSEAQRSGQISPPKEIFRIIQRG